MSISKEKFKEMLREKGLKVTNQRILVLEVLADHRDKHLTAEDIYELVREDYPEIGLATIYRTVQLLLEMQLVDRINLDDGCARYEYYCCRLWIIFPGGGYARNRPGHSGCYLSEG